MQLYGLELQHSMFPSAVTKPDWFRNIGNWLLKMNEVQTDVVVVSRDDGVVIRGTYRVSASKGHLFLAKDSRTLLKALELIASDPVIAEGPCQIAVYTGKYHFKVENMYQYLGPMGMVMDYAIAANKAHSMGGTAAQAIKDVVKGKLAIERNIKDIRRKGSWLAIGPKLPQSNVGTMVGVIGASTTIGGAVRLLDPYFGDHEDTADAGMF